MDSRRNSAQRRRLLSAFAVAALTVSLSVVVASSTPAHAVAVGPIDLGRAAPFAILAGDSVGNTATGPTTIVRGDLGVFAAAGAVTGFPPGEVHGIFYASGAASVVNAHADLVAAYDAAASRPSNFALAADLIGLTLHPGVHTNAAAVANTGTVTLNGDGDANAVFIFQIGAAFSMGAGAKVILTNGTQAKNVFWQVNGAGAIGAGVEFAGTLMTAAAIGVGANTVFNGRALAKTGAITTNSDQFYSGPPAITITGGAAVSVADDTPTISGTAVIDTPATVTVTVGTQTLSAAVQAGGTWTVTAAIMANGVYAVNAAVTDGAANTGAAAQSLTIDTVLPVVTITGGAARLTNDSTPTIDGTTDVSPGRLVTVTVAGQTLTTLVQPAGTWNVTPTPLSDGTGPVVVSVADEATNPGSATQALTVDTVGSVVTISGGANALTNDPTPTISGTSTDPGAAVNVMVSGITTAAVVQGDGTWSSTAAAFGDGAHPVAVSVTDAAGNVGTASQSLTIDTVPPGITIDGGAAVSVADETPTISGSTPATPGSTITVTVAGQSLTTLVQGDGSWNTTPNALTNGEHTVIASVSDPAGNISTATQALTVSSTTGTTTTTTTTLPPTTTTTTLPPTTTTTTLPPTTTTTTTLPPTTTTTLPPTTTTTTAPPTTTTTTTAPPTTTTTTSPPTTTTTAPPTTTATTTTPHPGAQFTSLVPARVLDSRSALSIVDGQANNIGIRADDTVTALTVTGRGGVPADAAAVVMNVTVTEAHAAGYLTVYPCGSPRPTASNLNYTAGSTVANAVIVKVGTNGQICIYNQSATHLLADINGYFPAGSTFTSLVPARVLESRSDLSTVDGQSNNIGIRADDTVTALTVTGRGGVPADAAAVVLNVTVTQAQAAGYLTVYPCGSPRPTASNLNYTAGSTVANAVIVKVGTNGQICIYNQSATHLLADINGYFPAGSTFTSMVPARVLESRSDLSTVDGQANNIGIRADDTVTALTVTGRGGVPADAAAVVLNVTVTEAQAAGYLTVYPCGSPRPTASNLNYTAGSTVANAVIVKVGTNGQICIYNQSATHLLADINGYFPA